MPTTDSTTATPATALEQVLQALERLILEDLEPHDSLPAEGSLARDLGVSRLTVREAMKVLTGRGLVDVSQGRRPTVAEPSGASIGAFFSAQLRRDPSSLLDLLEVRQALETHTAVLAARRASRAAITALEATVLEMRSAGEDPEVFHDADVRFHGLLALASGNQLLSFLVEALEQPFRESFHRSYEGHQRRGVTRDQVIRGHEAIVACVAERDEQGARTRMAEHLRQAELDLKAALRRPIDLVGVNAAASFVPGDPSTGGEPGVQPSATT